MSDTAEKIFDIYTHFGAIGVVMVLVAFLVVSQFSDLGKRVNKVVVEKIFNKKKKFNIPYDAFIRKIEHIRDYNIKKVEIKCKKRREVFVDFATNRMNNFISFLKSIRDKDFSSLNNDELYYFFIEEIYKTRENSSIEVSRMGIPYDVVERMIVIEEDEIKIFNSLVANICASNSDYISNGEKVAVVIDFLCALLSMTVVNAETAIDSLNGQLDDLVYRGYGCDNCKDENCPKKKKEQKNV